MSDTAPIIGILEPGRPPKGVDPSHGDYPFMAANWAGIPRAKFKRYSALDIDLPDDPHEADLWIITGSRYGVYEGHDWIAPLEDFVRAAFTAQVPLFGICFGHQIIAQALGGVVRKSDKGWGLGVHHYQPVNWPADLPSPPERFSIQAFHQDQVEELPQGAQTIAGSDFCKNAMIWYPGKALTIQGHPEFSADYVRNLLHVLNGRSLTDDQVVPALDTLATPTNRDLVAKLMSQLFLAEFSDSSADNQDRKALRAE